MSCRYYVYIGAPGRVFFDGPYPNCCEWFNPETRRLERNNAVMLDMVDGHMSREITLSEFEAMVAKATTDQSPSQSSGA